MNKPKFKVGDWVICRDKESSVFDKPIVSRVEYVSEPIINRVTGKITYCYNVSHDIDHEHPLDWYEDEVEPFLPELKNNKDKEIAKGILDI